MPLQIRRGTADEKDLLSVPLANGELLWTTDSKQLYIGDGVNLARDLTAVVNYSDEDAQDAVNALFSSGTHTDISYTYDDVNNTLSSSVSISQLRQNVNMGGFSLSGSGSISIEGNIAGEEFSGVLKGSVFGDDSVQLINADQSQIILDGTVKGDIIPDVTEEYDLGRPDKRFKDLYLSGSSLWLGMAQVTASGTSVDLPAGSTIDGQPLGEIAQPGNALKIDIIGEDSSLLIDSSNGNIQAGDIVASSVTGDFKGSVFGDDSSVVLDVIDKTLTGKIASQDGTVVFDNGATGTLATFPSTVTFDGDTNFNSLVFIDNDINATGITTSLGGFQGDLEGNVLGLDSSLIINAETNTITVNNVNTGALASDNQELNFQSTTGSSTISINSIDDAGILALRKISDADLSGTSPAYGRIVFARDDANGPAVTSLISGTDLALVFAVDDTATFADTSKFFTWTGSRFGIGTASPSDTLDVNGNGKFEGDVQAAAFKGSIVSDDSTVMVDAVDNTITAGSFIQFGSLTSTDRDNLTAANGMVIYNTTNNKFEGYQNGAWINLDDGTAAS